MDRRGGGGGLGCWAGVIFVVVMLLGATGKTALEGGIPATGINLSDLIAPNPAVFDEQAAQSQADADRARAQAQAAREWSASATRTAAEELARQTQAANEVRVRETAQAVATEQEFARMVIGWTATADSANSTATAQARGTETAIAYAKATRVAVATETVRKREMQQEAVFSFITGLFWALLPYAVFAVFTYIVIRMVRAKTGTVIVHGNNTVYDKDAQKVMKPEVQAAPVLSVKTPAQPTAIEQEIMKREQTIKLTEAAARNGGQVPMLAQQPRITIEQVNPDAVRPILDEVEEKLMLAPGGDQ